MDVASGIGIRTREKAVWTALASAWLAAITIGSLALIAYASAPGLGADAPSRWPADSQLAHDPELPTLVMLAHPLCPCSRASVAELERIMARVRGQMRAHVVLLRSEDGSLDDEHTLEEAAAAIPGVTVHDDPGGVETDRFGARTSGQTLLYGPDGRLRFAGGITAARGHEGDSYGADAVVAAVQERKSDGSVTAPVFGCSLGGAHAAPDGRDSSS